jgi:hypothetical protein
MRKCTYTSVNYVTKLYDNDTNKLSVWRNRITGLQKEFNGLATYRESAEL